jgi:hypothetical protein
MHSVYWNVWSGLFGTGLPSQDNSLGVDPMSLLIEVNRPNEYASPSLPTCQLRVDEEDGCFKIQSGQKGSGPQTTTFLSEYEARTLYETLRKRFGDTCLACERRAAFDTRTAGLLGNHAGLLAIAQLEWPRVLAELDNVRDAALVVGELACRSDATEVAELAEDWNLSVNV